MQTELDGFPQQWRSFFMSRARADQPLAAADYGAFPRFVPTPTPALVANAPAGWP